MEAKATKAMDSILKSQLWIPIKGLHSNQLGDAFLLRIRTRLQKKVPIFVLWFEAIVLVLCNACGSSCSCLKEGK